MGKEKMKYINRNNKDLFYRYCLMFVLQAKDPTIIVKALVNGIDYFEIIKNSNNNDTFKAILKEHQNARKNAEK